MRTRSSPLPSLPLEVKHHILRFCDPSTLAKTAQVSLAFLELSSPLLYEDVHVDGIEALKLLFSKRVSSYVSASVFDEFIYPDLSLGLLRTRIRLPPSPSLPSSPYPKSKLSPSPSPFNTSENLAKPCKTSRLFDLSRTPLSFSKLQISVIVQEGDELLALGLDIIYLSPLVRLLDPLHLSLLAPLSPLVLYFEVEDIFPWTRLESLALDTIATASPLFRPSGSRARPFIGRYHPHLDLVTYQLNQVDADEPVHDDRVECMLGNLPMPEGVQVVVVVGTEEAREEILVDLRELGEARGNPSSWKKVLAQVTVEVKQRS